MSKGKARKRTTITTLVCSCVRCASLEELILNTTRLAREIEHQRECVRRGAEMSLGLLKIAGNHANTELDRMTAMLAVNRWLAETASNVLRPIPWATPADLGIEQKPGERAN